MEHISREGNIYIKKDGYFSLEKTFDCGQCFRFEKAGGEFRGVAFGRELTLSEDDESIIIKNMDDIDFNNKWRSYFDLDRDYRSINKTLSSDAVIKKAISRAKGIRILHQDEWETICSFIISQNNNIPRIKKIINSLCENFGTKIKDLYSFPSAAEIAAAGLEELAVIRSGFRAKYIIDAAEKISSGEIDINGIYKMDYESARTELMKIKGIGDKVASCVLLFGFGFYQSFPKDVWIKKVIDKYYDEAFTPEIFGDYAGIAQQYLFYYERYTQ